MRKENAAAFAIMYVLFCAVAGLMIFRWFNRNAPDHTTAPEPGAVAPTKEQTWTRRKGTLGGLLAIALGLGTAMVMYLVDSSSPFDFFKMHARDGYGDRARGAVEHRRRDHDPLSQPPAAGSYGEQQLRPERLHR